MDKKNLTKKDIINKVNSSIGLSKSFSSRLVNDIINVLISSMKYTKQIKIPNFGTFKILEKTERIGRNPKTKELSKITPRKVITFRASVALKEKLKFSMNDKKK